MIAIADVVKKLREWALSDRLNAMTAKREYDKDYLEAKAEGLEEAAQLLQDTFFLQGEDSDEKSTTNRNKE